MSPAPLATFLARLDESVRTGAFVRLVLGKPRGADPTLRSVQVRPLELKTGPHLSFLWRHERRDETKNLPPEVARAEIARLLGGAFHSAHLFATAGGLQLEFNKKGEPRLTRLKPEPAPAATAHDREKARLLPASSVRWLQALGVLNAQGGIREGMADKHRQIHRFVEILSHLLAETELPADRALAIADMGCGKGYLTFAVHDFFNVAQRREADVRGIEARAELVDTCNRVARECGATRLSFEAGTIASARLGQLDVLIALHACDTATDDAIARGIAAKAALIVVAPCCQKELRPQLRATPALAAALRHGIFQERHAEFATDALRALLLEWAGYRTKVFEFISTEHTAKNTMIAAIRQTQPAHAGEAAARVRELARFYGIETQALAVRLGFDLTA